MIKEIEKILVKHDSEQIMFDYCMKGEDYYTVSEMIVERLKQWGGIQKVSEWRAKQIVGSVFQETFGSISTKEKNWDRVFGKIVEEIMAIKEG